MIQMIVTDLDGTLLNDEKELPDGFENLEKELRNRGIVLAVASGRPYVSMNRILNKYTDHILFIAENGGLIKYREKVLKSRPMQAEHVHELIQIARGLDQCHILLCGEKNMWYESKNETFIKESGKYYDHMIHVSDLLQITEP
ncbi:MAG: HAD family phosphatase, partial [Bacteroidetes bacterium]|nr:HAD family phosphatase [Bacteroidota bacterium]